jgi:hypothetical protein
MRFMIIVKATRDSEAGVMPDEKILNTMAKYHEELAKAGVLVDASGLKASAKGWRVKYSGAKAQVVDGPFTEAKELIAGYTIINVKVARRGARVVAPLSEPVDRRQGRRDRSAADVRARGLRAEPRGRALPRNGHRREALVADRPVRAIQYGSIVHLRS